MSRPKSNASKKSKNNSTKDISKEEPVKDDKSQTIEAKTKAVEPQPPAIEVKQPEELQSYQFLNKDVSVHLLCPQCKQLMKSPLRLHPCAHTFCEKCSPVKGSCPLCNTKVRAVQKDLIGEGLVDELVVRCLNDGCPFKGTFEDYKKYHKDSCNLKVGGLDEWIKGMKSTFMEQSRPTGQQGETTRRRDEAECQRDGDEVSEPVRFSGPSVIGQYMNWDDETKKELRREL